MAERVKHYKKFCKHAGNKHLPNEQCTLQREETEDMKHALYKYIKALNLSFLTQENRLMKIRGVIFAG